MRFNRAKLVRKHLRFFRIVFGISAPYDVILDGNFIFSCLSHKIDIRDRLSRLLQGEKINLYVTRSALSELQQAGSKTKDALEFATKFCKIIEDKPMKSNTTASESILSYVEQELSRKRYFIATQDKDLRLKLNHIPGVPTIYFNKLILILESPSLASKQNSQEIEKVKMALTSNEESIVNKVMAINSPHNTHAVTILNNNSNSNNNSNISNNTANVSLNKDSISTNNTSKIRIKPKAKGVNPLAKKSASDDSRNTKKKKNEKFKKR